MKKTILLGLFTGLFMVAFGQTFRGVSAIQKKQLLVAGHKIPVPTYLPAGFVLDSLDIQTSKQLKAWEKVIYLRYSRKQADGKWQSFYVEAGFDGIGSLWYDAETVQSGVGKIDLYYQPMEDEDGDGKKTKIEDMIGTEWFTVGGTAFHVYCFTPAPQFQEEPNSNTVIDPRKYTIIPKTEFKKILQSLKIFK
jgi:hypothetical protein